MTPEYAGQPRVALQLPSDVQTLTFSQQPPNVYVSAFNPGANTLADELVSMMPTMISTMEWPAQDSPRTYFLVYLKMDTFDVERPVIPAKPRCPRLYSLPTRPKLTSMRLLPPLDSIAVTRG